jgi:pimeloyl-ACP methyl ester carboxylesterase
MKTSGERVRSADGTSIALEVTGSGSAVVLIGGAFNDRTTTAGLAQVLAPYYQAVTYDRRGRGESGDESVDYSVDREMADLQAVIGHLGGTAFPRVPGRDRSGMWPGACFASSRRAIGTVPGYTCLWPGLVSGGP